MNKNKIPPAPPKSPVPGAGHHKNVSTSANGYSPKYTPPPEPTILPAPKVETRVEVPAVLETTSLSDLVERILDNASVLYPGEKVKCTTAVAASGVMVHAVVVAPKNPESQTSRFKVLYKGPGIAGDKKNPAKGRRDAIVACLEELERRVGKELLA
ncbi:hypothetical protein NA57DRAFT_70053 [Rhizodiscina lignyota]|uniref:Uncharacterized protein n=1 Tax=Rhizodiscina lignyota TaxID=1504668 RepID=A0A9P4IR51_9PEZI|nr:hypothetical protein NA57DRAFT_70053 [Rhizodiscina lignyota]